jgi:hypothetical protein
MGTGLAGGLGSFPQPEGMALAASPSTGEVVVGGTFNAADGTPASGLARWNGSSWHPLGAGSSETVPAVGMSPTGELVASGRFPELFGQHAFGVARWTGSAWSAVGEAFSKAPSSLVFDSGGRLIASGDLNTIGFQLVESVVVWNGTQWSTLPGTWTQDWVRELAPLPGGGLVATGDFDRIAVGWVANQVAMYDGAAWSPMGQGLAHEGYCVTVMPDGDIIVGGFFEAAGGVPAARIARWDGSAWHPLGAGLDWYAQALAVHPSGELLVGGAFKRAAGMPSAAFARYTFTNAPWVALHPQGFMAGPGGTVTLSATPAIGYDNLAFRWQRESAPGSGMWIDLADGPGGASPGGGVVIGSSGVVNGGRDVLLSISGVAFSDAGAYRCVVSNACGQDESTAAVIGVTNPCPPDLTATAIAGQPGYGVPNGTLNNDDFFYFLTQFAAGNLAVADLTTSALPGSPGYGQPNGVINNDDFFYYLAIFAAGC